MTLALDVAGRAVAAASGDEVEAVVLAERSGLARFAESQIHQPTLIDNLVCTLRIARDGRVGTASTNRIDADGLREAISRASAAADSAPPDPEFVGLSSPTVPAQVEGYDEETAALTPEDQARLATAAIAASPDTGLYGFFTSGVTELGIASSNGVSVEQAMTDAMALVVASGTGCSGYAEQMGWAARTVDPAAVAREAAAKAARTKGAGEIEPGHYAAVLEPYALAELLQYFSLDSLGALGLLEERGFFAGRIGERVFDPKVSIAEDALDPRGAPKAFDFEGVPKQRVQLVEGGIARGVVWDRRTAGLAGSEQGSTGHAPPSSMASWGPLPFAISMAGGEAESVEELAELVGDGIYVTRLHYLGVVQPREGVITGMTRDGTFRIRGGKIAEPLVNLRFTVAMPELLAEVPGLTREVSLVNASDFYGERYPIGTLAPAIATARFNITGTGSTPGI